MAAYGEYRLSRDADFLAADRRGYASLRAEVRERGVACLFLPGADVRLPREAREGPIPEAAWRKAEGAYGPTAARDLERAAERFVEREQHQKRCFERLDVRGREDFSSPLETSSNRRLRA
jgi:hypothetical protein